MAYFILRKAHCFLKAGGPYNEKNLLILSFNVTIFDLQQQFCAGCTAAYFKS
jgi:hypothetical protein